MQEWLNIQETINVIQHINKNMNIQEIQEKKKNTIFITDKNISKKANRRKQSQLDKEYMWPPHD